MSARGGTDVQPYGQRHRPSGAAAQKGTTEKKREREREREREERERERERCIRSRLHKVSASMRLKVIPS